MFTLNRFGCAVLAVLAGGLAFAQPAAAQYTGVDAWVYSEDVEYFTYGSSAVGWTYDQPDGFWKARAEAIVAPDIAQSQWKAVVQADNRQANGPGYHTDLGAFCFQGLPWDVQPGPGVQPGTMVDVNFSFTFDGTLRVGPTCAPTDTALFDASLAVSSNGGFGDLANEMHGAELSLQDGLVVTNGLGGATLLDQSAGGAMQYYIQHTVNASFQAIAGEAVWVDFAIQPIIMSETGIGLDALADFYNTATYQLTSEDANFVLLPEPTALSLLGMGGLVALRRRR